MSISLYVKCNCLKNGNYKPLPMEIEPYVKIENNTCYFIEPELGEDGFPNPESLYKYDREWGIYLQWERTACKHGNGFRAAHSEIGQRSLPFLADAVYRTDTELALGSLHLNIIDAENFSPEECKYLLDDIRIFNRKIKNANVLIVNMVDLDNNFEFRSALYGRPNEFMYSYDETFIFDENGLIISKDSDNNIKNAHFISEYFSQEVTSLVDKESKGRIYKFTDIKSGKQYLTDSCIDYSNPKKNSKPKFIIPKRIQIQIRKATTKDFEFLTKPLAAVFAASVEMGNPLNVG